MRLLGVLLITALLATACGGNDDDSAAEGADVRPFSEVQATDFVFEADPADLTRGIFRVETTEPMICAIVWGETEELGNFNNSLAMNGTGIVDHDVFLPGAQPGTEYHFQVQGSTADGTLYQSELATFTIPEPAGGSDESFPAPEGSDVTADATVADVSSEFSDSFAAALAIDGDLATEWSTDGSGDDAFITLDLGEPRSITGVEFVTRSMADGTAITDMYTVTVDDGEALGPFPAASPAQPRPVQVDATGQVLRFDVESSTGGNTGAVEVRVFADG